MPQSGNRSQSVFVCPRARTILPSPSLAAAAAASRASPSPQSGKPTDGRSFALRSYFVIAKHLSKKRDDRRGEISLSLSSSNHEPCCCSNNSNAASSSLAKAHVKHHPDVCRVGQERHLMRVVGRRPDAAIPSFLLSKQAPISPTWPLGWVGKVPPTKL